MANAKGKGKEVSMAKMTFVCKDGTIIRLYGLTPWNGAQLLKVLAKLGLKPRFMKVKP